MKKFKFTISGNDYEVEVKKLESNIAKIEVNGTTYNIELHKEERTSKTPILVRPAVARSADSHKIAKSSDDIFKVKAPLPGNIMQIFVKVGDSVAKSDKLLMYEAMKMENNLLAEKAGVIKSIKVHTGDSVLQDDVLVEIHVN